MKIVVTGGIGAGKSTVMAMLERKFPSYHFADFDKIVHQLYEDPTIQGQLDAAFGTHDRAAISDVVFVDETKKQALYDIINPAAIAVLEQTIADNENLFFEVPLYRMMVENDLISDFADRVVLVTCVREQRLERILYRNPDMDATKALLIMEAQDGHLDPAAYDYVIETDRGMINDQLNAALAGA